MRIHRRRPVAPAPAERFLGLDLSLSSTGAAYRVRGTPTTERVRGDKLRGAPRLSFIRNAIRRIVQAQGITHVVLEGYAMNAKGKVFNIGELGGVILLLLWELGVEVRVVPPSNLKLAATGKGSHPGQKKLPMKAAAEDLFGCTLTQDDEIDAFLLLMMGEAIHHGTGPAEFVMRSKKQIEKTEVRPGRVQSIAPR